MIMIIRFVLIITVAVLPRVGWGQYVSYLWAPAVSSISGYINYRGWGSGSVNTELSGWSVNYANAVYSICDNGSMGSGAKNQAYDWFVFVPKKIELGGVSATVTPRSVNGWTYSSMSNELWVMKKMIMASSYNYDGKQCPLSSFSYNFSNLSPGNVPISVDFVNVPVGNYSTIMKVKIQFSELFWSIGSTYKEVSNQVALNYAQTQDIPVNINVDNKCTVSDMFLNMEHGKLSADIADNNVVNKNISVHCTGKANIKLDLHTSHQSDVSYSNGLGVDVGNGWDSLLSIKAGDKVQYERSIVDVINADDTKTYSLRSILKKKKDNSSGFISGSAVLEVVLP